MPTKPDIWMPLYIGDYLAATAHLDALESGAYLHLLMHQWKNERLPAELEGLRRIAKVDKDAWSNAWVLLEPFFDHAQGFPVQLRLETIREEWKCKQLKAQEKAKMAAGARWRKDAPSIAQAMHNPCPSSSSSSSSGIETTTKPYPVTPETGVPDDPQKPAKLTQEEKAAAKAEENERKAQEKATAKAIREAAEVLAKSHVKELLAANRAAKKNASPPTKTEYVKTRHAEFKCAIFEYWKSKNPNIDCPWDQTEGVQLEFWLKSSPNTTIVQFKEMLRNRYRSEVVHSERPSVWIKNITSYANGPLNTFKQPLNGGGGRTNGKSADRAFETATRLIQEIEDNNGAHTGELLSGSRAN